MSEAEVVSLVAQDPGIRREIGVSVRPPIAKSLQDALAALVARVGLPVFARISPCSFKDGLFQPAPIASADGLLRQLQQPGARAASMALRCLWGTVPVSLIIRPWQLMRPWEEFRMFIREGTLSAISQHHPGAEGPDWSEARAFALAVTLRNFGERLVAACHLDTFAADVFVSTATDFVLLIETNPWGENTDPCLYDWHKEPPVDKALRLRRSGVIWRIPFERL